MLLAGDAFRRGMYGTLCKRDMHIGIATKLRMDVNIIRKAYCRCIVHLSAREDNAWLTTERKEKKRTAIADIKLRGRGVRKMGKVLDLDKLKEDPIPYKTYLCESKKDELKASEK